MPRKKKVVVTLSMSNDQLVRALGIRGHGVKQVELSDNGLVLSLESDAQDPNATRFPAAEVRVSEQSTSYRGPHPFTHSRFVENEEAEAE